MNTEFIPKEQASELILLGFNERVLGGYYEDNTFAYHPDSDIIIDAPLYQQAFRWFREKHNLNVCSDFGNKSYFYWIISTDENSFFEPKNENDDCIAYPSYEEVELECIKQLIQIVKNNGK